MSQVIYEVSVNGTKYETTSTHKAADESNSGATVTSRVEP